MPDDAVFATKNLSFSYGQGARVLHDVSLQVPCGKITAVLGANGCGKSTLFRLLCGFLKPTSGEVLLHGKEVAHIPRKEFARQVSIVHQSNTAPGDITVRKLVALGRTPYHRIFSGAMTEADRACVERALSITDTAKFAELPVLALSGGQRQRVWLAMALAQDAKVLLLDEITTYLDIYYQLQLMQLVYDLNRKDGITVVMILHDINQAIQCSDHTIIMRQGRVLASGETSQVITQGHLYQAFHVEASIRSVEGKKIIIYGSGGKEWGKTREKASASG